MQLLQRGGSSFYLVQIPCAFEIQPNLPNANHRVCIGSFAEEKKIYRETFLCCARTSNSSPNLLNACHYVTSVGDLGFISSLACSTPNSV